MVKYGMSREFEYRIEYDSDSETGQVTATVPELNSISSFGASFAEAEANVREAVLGYLEVLQAEGREIPEPAFHTDGTYLKLLVPNPV